MTPDESFPHGEMRGYWRHYRRGEKPCVECREAKRKYQRGRPVTPLAERTFRKAIEHGTRRGASAHYRRGEKPCAECREAINTYARASYAARAGRRPRAVLDVDIDEWIKEQLARSPAQLTGLRE